MYAFKFSLPYKYIPFSNSLISSSDKYFTAMSVFSCRTSELSGCTLYISIKPSGLDFTRKCSPQSPLKSLDNSMSVLVNLLIFQSLYKLENASLEIFTIFSGAFSLTFTTCPQSE